MSGANMGLRRIWGNFRGVQVRSGGFGELQGVSGASRVRDSLGVSP